MTLKKILEHVSLTHLMLLVSFYTPWKYQKTRGYSASWAYLTLSWRRPLSCRNQSIDIPTNQWTGFYMITASVMKELSLLLQWFLFSNVEVLFHYLLLWYISIFPQNVSRYLKSCMFFLLWTTTISFRQFRGREFKFKKLYTHCLCTLDL